MQLNALIVITKCNVDRQSLKNVFFIPPSPAINFNFQFFIKFFLKQKIFWKSKLLKI